MQHLLKGTNPIISVIGLGYVGLPVALSFAKKYKVIGFDINSSRIADLKNTLDVTGEVDPSQFANTDIQFTEDEGLLQSASFYIICVPTDVYPDKTPDLRPLYQATQTVARYLKKGDVVVYESTVFPGCTEEECLPILEKTSGLRIHNDFYLGYSPERIVPGDATRPFDSIHKIISSSNEEGLEIIAHIYGTVLKAGFYKAPSIKVAEAAKVLENTQRDLNISLMNEMAIICDRLGIKTNDVIDAAATKWNFHPYRPGLVGGHCIGIDPQYLIYKSRQLGYEPSVIASGRKANENIPQFVCSLLQKALASAYPDAHAPCILILGMTFKENVADQRNSKVIDLIDLLSSNGYNVFIYDPVVDRSQMAPDISKLLIEQPYDKSYHAIVAAVAHNEFKNFTGESFKLWSVDKTVLIDIKNIYDESYSDYYESL